MFSHPVQAVALLFALASLFYVAFATRCIAAFARRPRTATGNLPPVTILKPVCGLDPGLYENLRSFCEQDYPGFQVVFGVADPGDPAVAVVNRLIGDLPQRDLALAINGDAIGCNRKVSNLANMSELARHDMLVIADSDMRVGSDYLRTIIAPFDDGKVGAVTCLYTGSPVGGVASWLGCAFINEWFLPSVLVANAMREIRYCFGATMAIRRQLLDRIGGFARLAPVLADDYMLGRLVSDQGYRVHLSCYLVENVVEEADLGSLFRHELRWARTVRTVQPLGFAFSFITHTVPTSLLYFAVAPAVLPGLAVVAAAVALRLLLHRVARRSLGLRYPSKPWLVPLRDLLSFGVWAASFFGRNVSWREHTFSVQADGQLALKEPSTS